MDYNMEQRLLFELHEINKHLAEIVNKLDNKESNDETKNN